MLVKIDGVFGIIGKSDRIAFLNNKYWLNGVEVSFNDLPLEAQKLINSLRPKQSAAQGFNQSWKLLLAEAEASGNYSASLVSTLRYRLQEISRCLTINSSKLVFK